MINVRSANVLSIVTMSTIAIVCGCDQPSSTPPQTRLVINIDLTKGHVTRSSVGWPISAGSSKVWSTENDGVATVKLAEGDVQTVAFSGLTMLAQGSEITAVQFRMPAEPFDGAYERAKSMSQDFHLSPLKNLGDWFALRRPHHDTFSSGVGRRVNGCAFGLTIGVTAIPRTEAFVELSYNFGAIERAVDAGDTPNK